MLPNSTPISSAVPDLSRRRGTSVSGMTSAEHCSRRARDAEAGKDPPVEAPVSCDPPGQDQPRRKDEHQGVGPCDPGEDVARVHETAEEGRYTGEQAEDQSQADQ